MIKALPRDIFDRTWMYVAEIADAGNSLTYSKKMVCYVFDIPYSQDSGFLKVKEYKEWRKAYLARKTLERRWVKF